MGKNVKLSTFKLKNGIRVVLVPLEGKKTVTVRVFLKIGSKYETRAEAGMSHFLEHMAFKGTRKRPKASDINKEMDSKGAVWNAETGFDYTSYYVTSINKNLEWMLDLESDILLNSTYNKAEVKKERGVIIEEIRMYRDNPMFGLSSDFFDFLLAGSPIGTWNIAGNEKNVGSFSRHDVVEFRNKYTNPEQMVVAVAGNISRNNNLKDSLEKYFGGLETNKNELPKVEMKFNDKKQLIKKKEVEQGHFVIGGQGLARGDDRKYALKMLEILVAGNSSSRLHEEIREKRGWAYYVTSEFELLNEGGMWAVQSGVMKSKLDEAIELTRQELGRMTETTTEDELKRAKDYVLGRTQLQMDGSSYWASLVGKRMLLDNELIRLEDELERLSKVKIGQVKELASALFVLDKMKLVKVNS